MVLRLLSLHAGNCQGVSPAVIGFVFVVIYVAIILLGVADQIRVVYERLLVHAYIIDRTPHSNRAMHPILVA